MFDEDVEEDEVFELSLSNSLDLSYVALDVDTTSVTILDDDCNKESICTVLHVFMFFHFMCL